ncbi:glycosyltransferase family 4 protein [Erysipelothrix anatis]|uniref:glycosyltransferase family 4 protein n=1 Tax=Erysipelothrix anatis TaxID=2683713 RepID=UPI00135979A0|nr:glycosyltransferase family 4 protein [Erysipelothrix anatis]
MSKKNAKKVLFVAKVDSHIRHFHLPYLEWFKSNNYEVHVASEGNDIIPFVDEKHDVVFGTNPFSKEVKRNRLKLSKIIAENEYEIIHTHTAVASVLVRQVVKKMKKRPRVIYTAHGFHFYKGGPKTDWIKYYFVEKYYSRFTDDLILINQQDYNLSVKKMHAKRTHYVEGVGVNPIMFENKSFEKQMLRKELDISDDTIVLTYIAEFNTNKNQELLLRSFSNLLKNRKEMLGKIKLILIGEGKTYCYIESLCISLDLTDHVELTGYVTDVAKYLAVSNIAISTSKREGLPINIVESMMAGLPIVGCKTRGIEELVVNGENGFLINHDVSELENAIYELITDKEMRLRMGQQSNLMSKKYSLNSVLKKMQNIYSEK